MGLLADLRRQRDDRAARGDHAEALILNDRIHTLKAVMRRRYPSNDDPQLELCLTGECDCASAAQCKFARCKNCDDPVSADGKTLVDWVGSDEIFEDRICP